MPTISVITPAYNAEKTIAQTIQSVLNQTFTDFEYVIIDDGSSDRTLEVIAQFQDPRIQVFSYPNAGYATSQNRGLEKISGEYVSFLDADDLWQPEKLADQLQALQSCPAAAGVYSWSDFIDENGEFLHKGGYTRAEGNVYAQFLVKNFLENGSTPMFKKVVFATVGGFDRETCNGADWDMWLRIAKDYEFTYVPKVQVFYRVSLQSFSSNLRMIERSCRQIIRKNFAVAPPTLQPLKRESLANLYLYLTFRAFDTATSWTKSLMIIRYLWLAIVYQPSLLRKRSRLLSITTLKILVSIVKLVIGTETTDALIQRFKDTRASST